ncbi:unnamed protein product [Prorocentrum cordatum]|uniref:Uncharacterized protein n=1 Tax=Prorocentrum cordatum TaxID=2364126 RepID=A0ABN9TG75_9DINO|nr:unnamed protein product [Polarella glacialis]
MTKANTTPEEAARHEARVLRRREKCQEREAEAKAGSSEGPPVEPEEQRDGATVAMSGPTAHVLGDGEDNAAAQCDWGLEGVLKLLGFPGPKGDQPAGARVDLSEGVLEAFTEGHADSDDSVEARVPIGQQEHGGYAKGKARLESGRKTEQMVVLIMFTDAVSDKTDELADELADGLAEDLASLGLLRRTADAREAENGQETDGEP